MSNEPQKRSRAWIRWVLWALLAVLVLYPLPVGPAAWICTLTDSDRGWATYGQLYEPVIWCATRSRFSDQIFSWYVGLVKGRFDGESG